ncbi:MAG: alpha/beta fold hydrolase [Bernardetiaceae bacterium]
MNTIRVRERDGFRYVDEGDGQVLLLLHGLFGALSNWTTVVNHFRNRYRILIPMLPIYELPVQQANLDYLTDFVERFVDTQGIDRMGILGNSLGGHIGLMYALRHPQRLQHLILTASSGLFERGMGETYPRRGNYAYVKDRVAYTFYDPRMATEDLVQNVFEVTSDRMKCLRMIYLARSAQKNNLAEDLHRISCPVLLIWGLNDMITPPVVAHEFAQRLPHSQIRFIDRCGHAPMMEHPDLFNHYVDQFFNTQTIKGEAVNA